MTDQPSHKVAGHVVAKNRKGEDLDYMQFGSDLEDLMLELEFGLGPVPGLEFGLGLQLLFEQRAFQPPPFLQQASLLLDRK